MDHNYAAAPFHPLPPEVTATGARIVSYLHGGGRCVVLVGEPGSGKTTTLDAVLAGMPAWVERVSNRIPQPLTLARILSQIGVPDQPDRTQALLGALADRAGPAGSAVLAPAVLAIDDAHTLTPETLASLAHVPGLGGPDLPGMVLLLCGEPGLLSLLQAPGLSRLRGAGALTLRMPTRGAAAGGYAALQMMDVGTHVDEQPRRWPYVAGMLGIAMLSAALLLRPTSTNLLQATDAPSATALADGPAGSVPPTNATPSGTPPTSAETLGAPPAAAASSSPPALIAVPANEPARPSLRAEPPATPEPATGQPAPDSPNRTAAPMSLDTGAALHPPATEPEPPRPAPRPLRQTPTEAQLRHGFEVFLNRAGADTQQLTPASREALFREYLQWRARTAP